jgi:hypothetical protein
VVEYFLYKSRVIAQRKANIFNKLKHPLPWQKKNGLHGRAFAKFKERYEKKLVIKYER